MFLDQGAAIEVTAAGPLADAVLALLGDERHREDLGRKALAILESNRGAVSRLLQVIEPALAQACVVPVTPATG